jgi:cold shock CspA family protein
MLTRFSARRVMAYCNHAAWSSSSLPAYRCINAFSTTTTDATPTSTTTLSDDTPSVDDENNHMDQSDFVLGRVKFFDRSKLYGFANPENDPATDIFIHRINFVTTVPFEESPKAPTLLKGDKIRFRIQTTPEGKRQAKEITHEDGKPIPPLRRSFLKFRMRNAFEVMGHAVYKAMKNTELTQDQQWQAIQQAYTMCLEREQSFHSIIERLGMKVEDFDEYEDNTSAIEDSITPYESVEQMKQDILSDKDDDSSDVTKPSS